MRRSIETAYSIKVPAQDIGIHNIAVLGSKAQSQADKGFIISNLPSFNFVGCILYDQALVEVLRLRRAWVRL